MPIVPVAAAPRPVDEKAEEQKAEDGSPAAFGIETLINTILLNISIPNREVTKNQPFQFAVDHCFQIKGQGTVMTGTILSGQVKIGDTIEIPNLKLEKKIKSMQMFRKPVQVARQGDRVGMCVAQLDSNQIERGLACTPGSMKSCECVLAAVQKIKFFTERVLSKQKFHITLGHQTAIGMIHFFSIPSEEQFVFTKGNLQTDTAKSLQFNFDQQYNHEDSIEMQE